MPEEREAVLSINYRMLAEEVARYLLRLASGEEVSPVATGVLEARVEELAARVRELEERPPQIVLYPDADQIPAEAKRRALAPAVAALARELRVNARGEALDSDAMVSLLVRPWITYEEAGALYGTTKQSIQKHVGGGRLRRDPSRPKYMIKPVWVLELLRDTRGIGVEEEAGEE